MVELISMHQMNRSKLPNLNKTNLAPCYNSVFFNHLSQENSERRLIQPGNDIINILIDVCRQFFRLQSATMQMVHCQLETAISRTIGHFSAMCHQPNYGTNNVVLCHINTMRHYLPNLCIRIMPLANGYSNPPVFDCEHTSSFQVLWF